MRRLIKLIPTQRGEKTIRSETAKVFVAIFMLLLTVGFFTIYSTWNGARKFDAFKSVYLPQLQAAELMKQRALEIISIFYLLASDQDLDFQMEQILRYEGLVADFLSADRAINLLIEEIENSTERTKIQEILAENRKSFDFLNINCQRMILDMMEGRKEQARIGFNKIYHEISNFKLNLQKLDQIVNTQLSVEADQAQNMLKLSSLLGISITGLAVLITIILINYLIRYLSVTLLPISNLMNNLQQAVFSIDKYWNIISPSSRYSSVIFGEEIIGKNIFEAAYKDIDRQSEIYSRTYSALISVFMEDEIQWILQEDSFPKKVRYVLSNGTEKVLKLIYTPLWNEERLVQNIMIVAEDITEIEILRTEALQKKEEAEIIQVLLNADRSDIANYFSNTHRAILDCFELTKNFNENSDISKIILQKLHMIKGNARLFNLRIISEATHATENIIVDLTKNMNVSESASSSMTLKLYEGIAKIECALAVYSQKFRQIYGAENYDEIVEMSIDKFNSIRSLTKKIAEESNSRNSELIDHIFESVFDLSMRNIFEKFEPMVMDMCKRLKKSVVYTVKGDSIVLHRDRILALRDISVHLLRNAVDHGIEFKDERIRSAKKIEANIEINLQILSENFCISIKDDGQGINTKGILKRAIEMGVLSEEDAKLMSHQDKLNLIFFPNLSTKEEVSSLSGRGIGMDIVKSIVVKLGGEIFVTSQEGQGTVFQLFFSLKNG